MRAVRVLSWLFGAIAILWVLGVLAMRLGVPGVPLRVFSPVLVTSLLTPALIPALAWAVLTGICEIHRAVSRAPSTVKPPEPGTPA